MKVYILIMCTNILDVFATREMAEISMGITLTKMQFYSKADFEIKEVVGNRMTRTQSALSFMQKKGVDALFAEHHSIKIDEIDEYLLESNIILNEETIFDNAPFDGSLSTEWNKQLKTNKDELGRETIMGLSALAMDKLCTIFSKRSIYENATLYAK